MKKKMIMNFEKLNLTLKHVLYRLLFPYPRLSHVYELLVWSFWPYIE